MHYFKRNIGDYHKKAGRLTMIEHGAYTLLLDACYDRERFPTLEEAIEWCWARNPEEEQAVEFVLKRFFKLQEDGTYVQLRVQEEIEAFHGKAEKNRIIAQEREAARKAKKHASLKNENETCTNGEEIGKIVHDPNKSGHLTINQEPLTKNQEPQNNDSGDLSKRRAREKEPSSLSSTPEGNQPADSVERDPIAQRSVEISVLLRNHGAAVQPGNPHLLEWAREGLSDAKLLSALEQAQAQRKEQSNPQPVNAGYLNAILKSQREKAERAKQPKEPPWWVSEQSINAKASSLGLRARPGEDMANFKARIEDAIRKSEGGAAA